MGFGMTWGIGGLWDDMGVGGLWDDMGGRWAMVRYDWWVVCMVRYDWWYV